MGRVNRLAAGLDKDRWITFGKRLESYRGVTTSLSQAEAAAAVGVSTRQWIRYTTGARVPPKRIPKIAELFGIPVGRMLLHAGYEPTASGVDFNAHLRVIRDCVFEGQIKEALSALYDFYYDVAEVEKRYRPLVYSTTANDFIAAAVAIDRMPVWLRQEFVEYLLAMDHGGRKQDFTIAPEFQKKVRASIKRNLRKSMVVGGRLSGKE